MVLITLFYVNVLAYLKPDVQFLYCFGRYGHKAFFVTLAVYAQESVVKEKVGKAQAGEFTYTKPATIQNFNYAMVSDAFRLALVYDREYSVYFLHAENSWQVLAYFRRLQ